MNVFLNLTFSDYVYAAILAFLIVYMIKMAQKMVGKERKKEKGGLYEKMESTTKMEICFKHFPETEVKLNGKTCRRGEKLIIKTLSERTIDGVFVGGNADNKICVITDRYIIAHNKDEIFEIEIVG